MKNTLLKVWGIVLTLAILSGLLMASVPVAAANSWTVSTVPTPVMGTDTNVYTIAGDGTTIYLWTATSTSLAQAAADNATTLTVSSTDGFPAPVSPATTAPFTVGGVALTYTGVTGTTFTGVSSHAVLAVASAVTGGAALFKSLDAGKTWSASSLTSPGPGMTMIKVNQSDSTQLVASDGLDLYRSTTSGKVWFKVSRSTVLSGSNTIYSIDIATDSNGVTVLVGTDIGVSQLDAAQGAWGPLGTWGSYGAALAVAFVPDYINAQEIVAVSSTGSAVSVRTIVPAAATGSKDWDQGFLVSNLNAAGITGASLAFPNDFSTANQVFVGLSGANPDVYRVTIQVKSSSASQVIRATNMGQSVYSVTVVGSSSNSTVLAGLMNGQIWSSTDADTSSSPTWASVTKSPSGTNVLVINVDTIVYAGTTGVTSAFYVSTDQAIFNGISFFKVPNVYTVVAWSSGTNTWFVDTTNSVARLIMNGQLVLDNGANGWGFPTGKAGSKTLYFKQSGTSGATVLQKTTDGGQTWSTVGTGFKVVTALTVIDDNTYWIGYTGYIKSNAGVALALGSVSENPGTITMVGDTGILVKTIDSANKLLTWLYSADSGSTWTILGTADQYAGRPTTYDGANKTVYIVDSSLNVYKWTLGTDTAWVLTNITSGYTLPDSATDITAIGISSGVVYITVNTTNNAIAQVWRSTNTTTNEFRAVYGTDKNSIKGSLTYITAIAAADGTQTEIMWLNYDPTIAPIPAGKPKLFNSVTFQDTVIDPLTLTSPVDQIFINNPVTFTWKDAGVGSTTTYRLEVCYDAAMTLPVAGYPIYTNNTTYMAPNFTSGTAYYWRVRVESALPGVSVASGATAIGTGVTLGMTSALSAVSSFTVKTEGNTSTGIGDTNSVYPAKGAVNISTSPVLSWGTVSGATYNVKIATDSAFNTVVDSKEGLTVAIYTPATALKANTTYYWEVQAVSNGIASDWVAFAFTTSSSVAPTGTGTATVTQSVVTPTIIVTIPTQATQPQATIIVTIPTTGGDSGSTPAWAWIVIAIGAVLVIAVIVLIVRTRRV